MRALAIPMTLVLLVAGGCEDEAKPESTQPIVGAMELPVSLRSGDARPSNPLMIEVSPTELRLDGRKVVDLQSGRASEADRRDDLLPKLEAAVRGGGTRDAAAVRMHVNVPYETLVAVLNTLGKTGVGTVAFEVRKPNSPDTGWMVIAGPRVQQPSKEPVEFEGGAQRRWDELKKAWDAMAQACLAGHSVDCDAKPMVVAEGGEMAITLLARGSALKVSFERFGVEEADGGTPGAEDGADEKPKHVALLDGVPPPAEPKGDEEDEVPPATHAAFTWKLAAATQPESPISLTMRPVCGARPCGTVVTSDYMTPSMRVLSFLGAAFPDGAPSPTLVFERPRR